MNAWTVLPIVFAIAAGWVVLVLQGGNQLDEILERWRADRETRRSVADEQRKRAALRGPRVLR